MRSLLWILLFLMPSLAIQAQISCSEKLIQALALYDKGQLDEAIALASSCTEAENTNDRWQAHRLLCLSYLASNKLSEARNSAEAMLNINPAYRPNALKDPVDLIRLLSTITVIPRFSLGLSVSAGSNLSLLSVPQSYVLGNYSKNYDQRNGLQIGTSLGFHLAPAWMLSAKIVASTHFFDVQFAPENWEMYIRERLTYVDLPLAARYIVNPTDRVRFFAEAGPYASYLLYANNDMRAESTGNIDHRFELNRVDVRDRRNPWNWGLNTGLGVYYKLASGQASFQTNYFHSLKQINKEGTRYSYGDQMYTYLYVDDDIYLNNLSFSFGYDLFLDYRVYHKRKGNDQK
ncbi:MAG: PorT family protein [Flavobacteriales bacterium]|nr:PorT family protein [Flavobacteriales bacterium]